MPSLPPDQLLGVLRWLAALALAGWLARPLALRLLPRQIDDGWLAGKALGWLIAGFVPWYLASAGLIGFATAGPAAGLLALALLRLATGPAPGRPGRLALAEVGFLALFVIGLAIRLKTPDLAGLEKPMNLGFMAAAMRSAAMPPEDMWFAGAAINYYYIGHAFAGLWALIAEVPADHGYQLSMATLHALTGGLAAVLAAALLPGVGGRLRAVAAGLAPALVLWGGNLHPFLYTAFRPWMTDRTEPYHFPDSTRFIGFDPPTDDKGFTEFVAYAFAVGDLHAHVLATPLFLLAMLVLLGIWNGSPARAMPPWPALASLGWLLGLAFGINAWDVAIIGLIGLMVAAGLALRAIRAEGGAPAPVADRLGAAAILTLAVAVASVAPFLAHFQMFGQGVARVEATTPLWQLLIVYGQGLPALLAGLLLLRKGGFVALLALAVLVLIALPELIRVRDIYGPDFARANTMFKLSFRSQMLLQIVAVAVVLQLAALPRFGALAGTLAAALLLAGLAFAPHVLAAPLAIRDLGGAGHLSAPERALIAAVADLPPAARHLEAAGDSYGPAGRIASFTGRPTVMGWQVHQWLWRGDPEAAAERRAAVAAAYEADDSAPLCRLVRRHQITHLVLGEVERALYPGLATARLLASGRVVHDDGSGVLLALDPGLCR